LGRPRRQPPRRRHRQVVTFDKRRVPVCHFAPSSALSDRRCCEPMLATASRRLSLAKIGSAKSSLPLPRLLAILRGCGSPFGKTSELSSRTSLTTLALSRDTISIQAAGAGSQKPRVGGGRTSIVGQRFPVVHASTLALCVTTSATVLPTKHLFGHDGP
jgi:hypothetical protein